MVSPQNHRNTPDLTLAREKGDAMPRQQSHHQTAWLHREGRVWMKGEEGGGYFVREKSEKHVFLF
jgi:hypothetical protein